MTSRPTTTDAVPSPAACDGRAVDVRPEFEDELLCHQTTEKYEVASGEIDVIAKSEFCDAENRICISAKCRLTSIAASLSSNRTVSIAQIAPWDSYILGACDHLAAGQFICAGSPGGAWVAPPSSEIPDDDAGPVRGGPGSTPMLPIIDDPTVVAPDRVQEGISADCTRRVLAHSTSAGGWKTANDAKITQTRLWELNPVLGENGEDRGNMVWPGYFYCIAREGDETTPPTTTTAR
ncbi:carbohydrate-binding module family 50 protein [Paramyrothecium foliicola]|nr:carbohydrate-binding module family 50 protein [Paramyrothecium foliicola]